MGLYDTFNGRCPSCHTQFEIQTKQFGLDMANFGIGSIMEADSLMLKLKRPCSCGKSLYAVIMNGKLQGFVNDFEVKKEKPFGDFEHLGDFE